MQWPKGISSRVLLPEFPQLRKKFWGKHFWARGYLAVSSGTITDEMIREYIDDISRVDLCQICHCVDKHDMCNGATRLLFDLTKTLKSAGLGQLEGFYCV